MLLVRVPPAELNISAFPPVLHDWVIKGLGMSSLVYATGHMKDPVPLIAKRRGLSPGGRFPHLDGLRCRQGKTNLSISEIGEMLHAVSVRNY